MKLRDIVDSTLSLILCTVTLWYGLKFFLIGMLMITNSVLDAAVEVKHYDHQSQICVEEIEVAPRASLSCEP